MEHSGWLRFGANNLPVLFGVERWLAGNTGANAGIDVIQTKGFATVVNEVRSDRHLITLAHCVRH